MSFYQTASSPWFFPLLLRTSIFLRSCHGREALHRDQLAICNQLDVVRFHRVAETVGRYGVQLALTVLAHLGESAVSTHLQQCAELGVVDADVRDDHRIS